MTPFDFINAINSKGKKDVMSGTDNDVAAEAAYVPYVANKTLSYFPETLMHANEANKMSHLDKKLQFHYLLNSIRPGKRYAKWVKKEDSDELDLVKQYYQFNDEKARQALALLSKQQLSMIRTILTNGVNNECSRPVD
jgi:hypothetical protein